MHPHFVTAGHWAHSLRALAGYPLLRPGQQTCSFASSCRLAGDRIDNLVRVATDTGTDIIHIAFDDITASDPVAVSLVIYGCSSTTWLPDVRPWAACETSIIEFLSDDRRWYFGAGGMLSSDELPPISEHNKGEAIAMRRWRARVANTAPVELNGSRFVEPGRRIADGIPVEDINVVS